MTDLIATPVVDNKFWIVKDAGNKVAIIRVNSENGKVILDGAQYGTQQFISLTELKHSINIKFATSDPIQLSTLSAFGYPVDDTPYNAVYDVQRRVPLYTKTESSKCWYCAGYYAVKYSETWLVEYCPKFLVITRNEFLGPFASKELVEDAMRVSR